MNEVTMTKGHEANQYFVRIDRDHLVEVRQSKIGTAVYAGRNPVFMPRLRYDLTGAEASDGFGSLNELFADLKQALRS